MSDFYELLLDLHEYFEGRADAEYFTDRAGPVGNEEMRFLVRIQREIALADEAGRDAIDPTTGQPA